jgi:hypothetical protein
VGREQFAVPLHVSVPLQCASGQRANVQCLCMCQCLCNVQCLCMCQCLCNVAVSTEHCAVPLHVSVSVFSGWPNQAIGRPFQRSHNRNMFLIKYGFCIKIGWPLLFKGLIVGTYSYLGADSASYKIIMLPAAPAMWLLRRVFSLKLRQHSSPSTFNTTYDGANISLNSL